LGFDIRTQKDEVKKHIGYLSQRFSLYQDLTIDENIDFFAEIHKIQKFKIKKKNFCNLRGFLHLGNVWRSAFRWNEAKACACMHTYSYTGNYIFR